LNWEIIWTTLGIGIVGLFLLPLYMVLLIALEKAKTKIHLEFIATANTIEKKVKFDESLERLFEEGEAL